MGGFINNYIYFFYISAVACLRLWKELFAPSLTHSLTRLCVCLHPSRPLPSTHPGTKADITVNNMLACTNTKLLRDYCSIDPRLRQLVFLVKHWAKKRKVNNAYEGTLSSYAYCLMAIAHLQRRQPPVLPCLQEMQATFTASHSESRGGKLCLGGIMTA